jgi:hypothetical protein
MRQEEKRSLSATLTKLQMVHKSPQRRRLFSKKKCEELIVIIAHSKAKADALKSKIAQNQAKIQELEAENLALQKELAAL